MADLHRDAVRHHRHAPRRGRPWTPGEDRAVLEAQGDLRALAARLGRTHRAVTDRRTVLRRRERAA